MRGTEATVKPVDTDVHPSAPIPVQGAGVGSTIRVDLGETGLSVFPVILGAAEFGWAANRDESFAILDHYAALGGNAVHTSDGYGAGRAEHIVGSWLQRTGLRDRMVVTARVGAHPDNPGLGAVNLVRAVEASLRRLGVETIDLLYLDATGGEDVAVEDTLATAEWLVDSGKVRALGAYGFTAERLVEARILASAGYPRVLAVDVPYNLLRRRDFEGDVRFVAGAQNLAVTPSHPLEHGFLSGMHRRKNDLRGARGMQLLANLNRRGSRVLKALDEIARQLGVTDAAVAIAWLLGQRSVSAPILNAFARSHVDELAQGVGVRLGRAHLAELQRAAT